MIEQEQLDKMHQQEVESKYSNGWYPIGVLEWTDDMPNYAECSTKGDDWVWVQQEVCDVYEHPGGVWKSGVPAVKVEGATQKIYRWAIGGSPLYGNNYKSKTPIGIIEILRYLVSSPVVAIGRPTDRGTPVMGIPKGVRLKGMQEWIMREETKQTEQ